jgi:MFS transporter, DHA2 family, methylenomycin A resistance protein
MRSCDETTSYVSMLPGQLIIRVGVALTAPSLMTALLACLDRNRSGMASALLNTFREAGSAIGVALFGALIVDDSAVAGIQTAINPHPCGHPTGCNIRCDGRDPEWHERQPGL